MSTLNVLAGFDSFFSQSVTLRRRQSPSYSTATGGLWTILIFGLVILMSLITFVSTISKARIHTSTILLNQEDPSLFRANISQNLMFSLGLSDLDMNEGPRYFDYYMEKFTMINNSKSSEFIPLAKCDRKQWENISMELAKKYDLLHFDRWLCPPSNLILEFQGKYTSEVFKYYKFSVRKCNQSLDPSRPCVQQSIIDDYLSRNDDFKFSFYFINEMLNIQTQKPISYYLDDFSYFPFTQKLGVISNMFISSYEIETDQTIYPWVKTTIKKGGTVLRTSQSTDKTNFLVNRDQYIKFYIRKSSRTMMSKRSYVKIDEALSTIGGLFTFLISISFLVRNYNKACYELELAQQLFDNQRKEKGDFTKFNMLKYLHYIAYKGLIIFKGIFGKCCGCFDNIKQPKIYKTLNQIRQQLDIRLIFKKMLFFQEISEFVLQKKHLYLLKFCSPHNLDHEQQSRKQYELYSKIKQSMKDKSLSKQKERKKQIIQSLAEDQPNQDQNEIPYAEIQELIAYYTQVENQEESSIKRLIDKKIDKDVVNYIKKRKQRQIDRDYIS